MLFINFTGSVGQECGWRMGKRNENAILRWICEVMLRNKVSTVELENEAEHCLGVGDSET